MAGTTKNRVVSDSMKSTLALAIFLLACQKTSVAPPVAKKAPAPPAETVIASLYRDHANNQSPFFQTTNRQRVDNYFQPRLADLIWNDAQSSDGSQGAIDFDPLYDAQDTDIKDLVIQPANNEGANARVTVTFQNFGKPHEITYSLALSQSGWKIADILYSDGRSLRTILQPKT